MDKLSSAADFARVAEERYSAKRTKLIAETSEVVTLPSGLIILACRPAPEWWVRIRQYLPKSLGAKVLGATPGEQQLTVEHLIDYAHFTAMLLEEMVLSPKIRLNPKEGEVDPNLIGDEDLSYLLKYAGGEIAATGQGLDGFPRSPGSTTAGAGSGPMEDASESAT